jgi:NAD(P)-dependent dehydrogenase (short-subunit alcohol dehydrogenase family)
MIDLADRVVLITGAGGGIGSATARTIAKAGGRALLHDVSAQATEALVEELTPSAHALAADLIDPNSAERLWAEALEVHGRIDVLINNAGIYPPAPLDAAVDDWLEVWDTSLAVNLIAPAILCKAAVATFADQPDGGIIINMASRAAFRGEDPDYWHYAAAKAGIVAMTRTIARQNGRQGITAFAVAPGFVEQGLHRAVRNRSRRARHGPWRSGHATGCCKRPRVPGLGARQTRDRGHDRRQRSKLCPLTLKSSSPAPRNAHTSPRDSSSTGSGAMVPPTTTSIPPPEP